MANTLNTESVKLAGRPAAVAMSGKRPVLFTYVDDNSNTVGGTTMVELDGSETSSEAQTKAVAAANTAIGN